MSKGGRPSKLDPARLRAVLDAVQAGRTRAEAARAAGVSRSTLQGWLARGQAGDPAFVALAEALRLARSAGIHKSNADFWASRASKLSARLRVRQSVRGGVPGQ